MGMEISVGNYGKHLFENMLGRDPRYVMADHWKSIEKEAKPLVEQLVALNDKMKGGGYKIVGFVGGTKKLTDHERIELAQEKMWTVKGGTLKEGDYIWCDSGDGDQMVVDEVPPAKVLEVTKHNVYVEMCGCNFEYIVQVGLNDDVIKAPKDWHDNQNQYQSDEWWLEQADKLGI